MRSARRCRRSFGRGGGTTGSSSSPSRPRRSRLPCCSRRGERADPAERADGRSGTGGERAERAERAENGRNGRNGRNGQIDVRRRTDGLNPPRTVNRRRHRRRKRRRARRRRAVGSPSPVPPREATIPTARHGGAPAWRSSRRPYGEPAPPDAWAALSFGMTPVAILSNIGRCSGRVGQYRPISVIPSSSTRPTISAKASSDS